MNALDLLTPRGMVAAMAPEIVLTMWAVVVLLLAGFRHRTQEDQRLAARLSIAGLVSTLVVIVVMWAGGVGVRGTPHMVTADGFRFAAASLVILGGALAVTISDSYLRRERILVPEYYALVLFAIVGMMVLCAAADLVIVFLGIELMSLCVYVLVGINRRSAYAAEGALKYFLLGAFASGFLLYGIALIFGATGTTNLTAIDLRIAGVDPSGNVMLLAGLALLLIGFAFKVAAVPFHMWTPDVYDGAPTPVTAFMAAAVKVAGFAAMLRVFVHALGDVAATWQVAVWWLAVLTMLGGNLMALSQRQIKRMLAYSSIGHAGYLLTAVASGTVTGASAFLFYTLAYTLMTIGAFAVVAVAGRDGERDLLIDDFAGLASVRPALALAMAVFMLSLLGFPGTAGFIGKWTILSASIEAGQWTLAVALVLASLVSAGFYLPVVMQMFMRAAPAADAHAAVVPVGAMRTAIGAAAVLLLVLGVRPNWALDVARLASRDLMPAAALTFTEGLPPTSDQP